MFFWVVLALTIVFSLIKFGIPKLSRWITGFEDLPMTVPGTLFLFYTILILIGTFVYVTSDEETLASFLSPIKKTLTGAYGGFVKMLAMALVPLLAAAGVYCWVKPTVSSPRALRIQHPSSNFPKKFETIVNPLENPTDEEVKQFIEQVKNNSVEFFPQVNEAGSTFTNINHIATPPVNAFLKQLAGGAPDMETAKAALHEKRLFEGRALYEINCRPCHGINTAGDGPMANGFKLRPIDFTDNGTIEVLAEGYTFWRVKDGGLGLPVESTPWDSSMPVWELDLTDEERWAIIMAAYNLAEKTPRINEKLK